MLKTILNENDLESEEAKNILASSPESIREAIALILTRSKLSWSMVSETIDAEREMHQLHAYIVGDHCCCLHLCLSEPKRRSLNSLFWEYRGAQRFEVLTHNKIETFSKATVLAALPVVVDDISNSARILNCPRCAASFLLGKPKDHCYMCYGTNQVSRNTAEDG